MYLLRYMAPAEQYQPQVLGQLRLFFSNRGCAEGMEVANMSWEEFKHIMTNGYASVKLGRAARVELYNLKQGKMTVPELSRELRRRVGKVPNLVTEHEQIFVFVNALRADIAGLCQAKQDGSDWDNLDKVLSYAATQEATRRGSLVPGSCILGSQVFCSNRCLVRLDPV